MKKILILGVAVFGLTACDGHDHSEHAHSEEEHMQMMKDKENKLKETEVKSDSEVYICPMHPHIKGEKGDNCPICGMHLTPQESNEDEMKNHSMNNSKADKSLAANISKQRIQSANIKTTTVLFGEIQQSFTAFSKVVSQNKIVESISMRDNGWIEKIADIEELDKVKKGDFLFEFYSPEIKSAQIDYVIALQQRNKRQASSSKIRLQNLGLQAKAIAELTMSKKVVNTTKFYAPIDGYIKELNINKGQYIKLGNNALTIQAEEELWVESFIDKDKLDIAKNAIKVEFIGKEDRLTLDSILPELDIKSQSYIARLKLAGSNLKKGNSVDVKFYSKPVKGLIIPKQAILNDSGHNYVFVVEDSNVTAKMIKTGSFDENNIVINEGLAKGDNIIINGQFLIDSEAKLQSSFGSMSTHNH